MVASGSSEFTEVIILLISIKSESEVIFISISVSPTPMSYKPSRSYTSKSILNKLVLFV